MLSLTMATKLILSPRLKMMPIIPRPIRILLVMDNRKRRRRIRGLIVWFSSCCNTSRSRHQPSLLSHAFSLSSC